VRLDDLLVLYKKFIYKFCVYLLEVIGMVEIEVEMIYSWEVGSYLLKIVGKPFTYPEFSLLKKEGLIWYERYDNDLEVPPGWYISAEFEKIEKLTGKKFPVHIKEKINQERNKRNALDKTYEIGSSFSVSCPVCGQELEMACWDVGVVVKRCYKHRYSAVINTVEQKIIDEGFDKEKNEEYRVPMFWDKVLMDMNKVR